MIFYFSGTGNSAHVAASIANSLKEETVCITKNSITQHKQHHLLETETLGFIFPVYWYSMPTLVEEFITNLTITGNQKPYIFAVATYGFAAGNVMKQLQHVLDKKGLTLDGVYGVKMVDNYIVGYNLPKKETQTRILLDAESEINKIAAMIQSKETTNYIKKGGLSFLSPITGTAYRRADHRKKFYVTNDCNGCKSCAAHCPCNVIEMDQNKPVWNDNCTFCLKCINSCNQQAIQYTKSTERRSRYQYSLTI